MAWVSVDKSLGQTKIWDRRAAATRIGNFCVIDSENPVKTIHTLHSKWVATNCPPGECWEIDGLPVFDEDWRLHITAKPPRTIEDVKQDIVDRSVYLYGDDSVIQKSHHRTMEVLVAEYKSLLNK